MNREFSLFTTQASPVLLATGSRACPAGLLRFSTQALSAFTLLPRWLGWLRAALNELAKMAAAYRSGHRHTRFHGGREDTVEFVGVGACMKTCCGVTMADDQGGWRSQKLDADTPRYAD